MKDGIADHDTSLITRCMGKLVSPRYITGCVNVFLLCPQPAVHLDALSIHFNVYLIKAKSLQIGAPSHSNQDCLRFDADLFTLALFYRDLFSRAVILRANDGGIQVECDPFGTQDGHDLIG